MAAQGRCCFKRHLCVEPALCWPWLGGPLRDRPSTCPHHLSPHGVRLLGRHQRAVAAVATAIAETARRHSRRRRHNRPELRRYAAIITTAAAVLADVVALAILAAAGTTSQTSAAWLARRTPRPQALPPPTGLCAGAPAGRPPDGVCTTQLLGTRVGGLRCDAQAGPCQACSRRSSCALATGVLLVLRAGVPAPPEAFGEDGK